MVSIHSACTLAMAGALVTLFFSSCTNNHNSSPGMACTPCAGDLLCIISFNRHHNPKREEGLLLSPFSDGKTEAPKTKYLALRWNLNPGLNNSKFHAFKSSSSLARGWGNLLLFQ